MKSRVSTVLFDFDGTLVDSHSALMVAYEAFLSNYGIRGTKDEFNELIGPSLLEIVEILRSRYRLISAAATLYEEYSALVERSYKESVEPVDGSVELLNFLQSANVAVCIVTSAPRHFVVPFLVRRNWQHFFSFVVTGDMVSRSKPDPEIYLKAMSLLDHEVDSVLAIEDSTNGVLSASSAGLPVIGVAAGNRIQELYDAGAFHVSASLEDLKNFLKSKLRM